MDKVIKDIRCNACSCQDTLCATFELDNSKKHCGC